MRFDNRDFSAIVISTWNQNEKPFPDWMNAPIRPIEPGKLDDLQAKTAEQRDWLEILPLDTPRRFFED